MNEFHSNLLSAYNDPKFAQQLSNTRNAAHNSQKRVPVNYEIGEKVWISRNCFKDNISEISKLQKLFPRHYVPFEIIQLIGRNAVKIELTNYVKIHPVVHVEHTKRYYK